VRPAGSLGPVIEESSGIFSRIDALEQFGRPRVRRWLATGWWTQPVAGVYVSVDTPASNELVVAAAARSTGLVAVLHSAAAIHGFGALPSDVVHLAGGPQKTARDRTGMRVHGFRLASSDITEIAGAKVTTASRTAVDLARITSRLDGLAVVDAALRAACTSADLAGQLVQQRSARGIVQARQLAAWGNGAAESPMESRTRLRILDSDLPAPDVQWWVRNSFGAPVYRLDLAWPEQRVGLEYDGADHLSRERQRHDLERRAWLAGRGWRILWVTDVDVYRQYYVMIDRLRDLLRHSDHPLIPGDHAEMVRPYGVSRTISA
jgi:hypothetical protein